MGTSHSPLQSLYSRVSGGCADSTSFTNATIPEELSERIKPQANDTVNREEIIDKLGDYTYIDTIADEFVLRLL